MTKKLSYNEKSREELILDLSKEKEAVLAGLTEKRKAGKAKGYRTARKNVARILTAINAKEKNETTSA